MKNMELNEFRKYRNYAKVFNQIPGGNRERAFLICEGFEKSKSWLVTNGHVMLLCEREKLISYLSAPILRFILTDTDYHPRAENYIDNGSEFKKAKLSGWRYCGKPNKNEMVCLLTSGKKRLTINAVYADLISQDDNLWISDLQLLITNRGRFKALVMRLNADEITTFPEEPGEMD